MSNKNYGLVFKIDNQMWLVEYKNGVVEEAFLVSDDENKYVDLDNENLRFVEINKNYSDTMSLTDLQNIKIENENDQYLTVADLIDAGQLPSFSMLIMNAWCEEK